MAHRTCIGLALLAATAGIIGHLCADGGASTRTSPMAISAPAEPIGGGIGPDVTSGAIQSIVHWTAGGPVMGIHAYSAGRTACNIGDANLSWMDGTNQHPLLAQNMYRLHDGRFEQIGQAWVKFTFCSLQQNLCGTCTPFCGGCCSQLGPGCSNPYTASRTGSPSLLGPKDHTINPATGVFSQLHAVGQGPATIGSRTQVKQTDLTLSLFPQARFFIQHMFIAPDDAAAGNDDNNASWREVAINQTTFGPTMLATGSGAPGGTVGGTNRQEVAMFAWQEFDTDAGPQPSVPVTIANADVPGDGRFILGHEVTNNEDGTWTYEYALMNYNSDRSAQAFSIPLPAGVSVSDVGFHDVDYHSFTPDNGSLYDLADWAAAIDDESITWSGAPFIDNINANALRWDTLYNFRFTADSPPQPVSAAITLFKPGSPATIQMMTHGPSPAPFCIADLDRSGAVDGVDLGILLSQWMTDDSADLNNDGLVDGLDLGVLLNSWTLPGGGGGGGACGS